MTNMSLEMVIFLLLNVWNIASRQIFIGNFLIDNVIEFINDIYGADVHKIPYPSFIEQPCLLEITFIYY